MIRIYHNGLFFQLLQDIFMVKFNFIKNIEKIFTKLYKLSSLSDIIYTESIVITKEFLLF